MAWVCWFEEFYFLSEWDDGGQFFYRCYGSYQKIGEQLMWWKLG